MVKLLQVKTYESKRKHEISYYSTKRQTYRNKTINIPEFDIKHVVRFTTHDPCMQHYNLIKYQIFLTLLKFGLLINLPL